MRFKLGFPNEEWNRPLGSLMIPVPGTDRVILVQSDRGKYAVINQTKWVVVDTLIMASALVHDLINNYVPEGGENAEEVQASA